MVEFPNRMLLAPMEGITDPLFRALVLELRGVGGASTEFVRVTNHAVRRDKIGRELDVSRDGAPVALQLMAAGPEWVAETIAEAEAAGAIWIDLNFGCPVKRVFGKGAGSALLDDPARLHAICAAAVGATDRPVSAKLRVGVRDDTRLDELIDAAGDAGVQLITLHARRRIDSYETPARWEWLAQAAQRVHARYPGVVFVGNGGVESAADAHEMMMVTGCDMVMVGRAALANPFLFNEAQGAPPATRTEAARFALAYLDGLTTGRHPERALGRFKQLVRQFRAGGLFDAVRQRLLRTGNPDEVRAFLRGTLLGT